VSHKFGGHWSALMRPERLKMQPPEEILALIGPRPGETVLDLGSGPGYVALPLGERVGPQGRVIAADIAPEALDQLRANAAAAGMAHVSPLLVEETRLPLGEHSVDAALMVNVLHELVDPAASLAELRRVLRPGGRLGIVDWDPAAPAQGRGPRPEERVPAERAVAWLRSAGFEPQAPVAVGAAFYGLQATRGPR
jgi:ubiquinone/menaquinone biosynthesis C-methylase UbiE